MCGIAGVLQTGAPVERDLLTGLCARLAHRGPDAEGIFQDGALGLAHTRLSIIDVRGGDQPLTNADGSVVVVANGEIYNHVEVREQLEARGHRFRTQSDCECLVHAWREWGDDFLDHLSGMFAFALWDRRDRCLLLARDRLGIKPLFVYQTAERIAFASELKALRPLLATEPEIDATGLAQYLNAQYTTGRTTLLAGVTRVLPGELWRIDSSLGVQRRRYWDLRDVSPSPMSAAEANEAFESLMQTVMREHMRTDVPFGLFLSGGLDSSSLLALLSELDTDPVRALSLGFSGHADHDESAQARTLAQAFTPRHTVLEVDRDAMFGSLPTSIWAADELMLDYASLPTLALARRAGAELKVVFTGEGGDEVFAGYGRYRMSAPERAVRALLHPGSGGFRTRGAFRGAWPGRLFRPPLSQALPCWREPVRELWNAARDDWSAVQKMQYVDLCTALPDNLLVKVDRMLMAHGVEGRVPLLDHRVVELGLALSDKLKIHGGSGKWLVRKWAATRLPAEVCTRRKSGFHVPVGSWLRGPLLGRVAASLAESPVIRHWFHDRGVRQLVAEQDRNGSVTRPLWTLLQLALWHRIFVENDARRPPAEGDPLALLG